MPFNIGPFELLFVLILALLCSARASCPRSAAPSAGQSASSARPRQTSRTSLQRRARQGHGSPLHDRSTPAADATADVGEDRAAT